MVISISVDLTLNQHFLNLIHFLAILLHAKSIFYLYIILKLKYFEYKDTSWHSVNIMYILYLFLGITSAGGELTGES